MIEYQSKTIYYAIFNDTKYYKTENGYYRSSKKGQTPLLHLAVWEFYGNEILRGYDIHHKDLNKDHNEIENLQQLTHEEHAKMHYFSNDKIQKECTKCKKIFITGNIINSSSLCDDCQEEQAKDYKRKWTKANKERLNKRSLEKYYSPQYRENRICKLCGKEFNTYKYGPQKLCSRSCAAKSKKCN